MTVCQQRCVDSLVLSGTGVVPTKENCGGTFDPLTFKTKGRTAIVKFSSDRTVSAKGFRILFYIDGGLNAPVTTTSTSTTSTTTTSTTTSTTVESTAASSTVTFTIGTRTTTTPTTTVASVNVTEELPGKHRKLKAAKTYIRGSDYARRCQALFWG